MRAQHAKAKALLLVVFAAGAIATLLYWLEQAGVRPPGAEYRLTAVVPDAVHLAPNSSVRQAGVQIGRVTRLWPRRRGEVAIQFVIDKPYRPLPRSTRVLVGMRTLLGESYLDVEPGAAGGPPLRSGEVLPRERTIDSVQLDQILAAFDARTRRHVRAHLRQMGRGLRGRGHDLNRLLAATRPTAADGATVMAVLRREREALSRLVDDTGDVMHAIGERDDQLSLLARGIRVTSAAVARRSVALSRTLDELAPSLRQARATARMLSTASVTATPVVADLRRAAVDLPALMRDVPPAARASRRLLEELPRLRPAADPLLGELRRFAGEARPLMGSLGDSLRELNPAVRHLSPYSRDLGSFLANAAAFTESRDRLGHLARVFPVFWQDTLAIAPPQRRLLDRVLDAAGVTRILKEQVNPFPRPGELADLKPLGEAPAPPEADDA